MMRKYLYRSSSGDLVLDDCPDDATHLSAPPDDRVDPPRRTCRTHLSELLAPIMGQRVQVSVDTGWPTLTVFISGASPDSLP